MKIFSIQVTPDMNDEVGILRASYIIIWSGIVLLIYTILKIVITTMLYYNSLSNLFAIGNEIEIAISLLIILMGCALTYSMQHRIKKVNINGRKLDPES